MSTRIAQKPLIIPKENLEVHSKKATKDGKTKRSKTAAKKGGAALGSRKALNDITNKSFLRHKTSRKKELPEDDIDIAEEGFLHDHSKCIEAQKISDALDWNFDLPGHDESMGKSTNPMPEPEKMDLTSPRCWDLEKLWIPESSWRSETKVKHISPPYSPLDCESPSLYTSIFESVDLESGWWSETPQ